MGQDKHWAYTKSALFSTFLVILVACGGTTAVEDPSSTTVDPLTPSPVPTDAGIPNPIPTDSITPDPKPTDLVTPIPTPTDSTIPGPEPIEPPEEVSGVSSPSPQPIGTSTPASNPSPVPTTSIVARTGEEYYQEFCVACHGEDGKLTTIGNMNVLVHTEEELYSEILLTMPTNNPDLCDQTCSIAVSDYIRDTLYSAELNATQKSLGVKPTKLLPSDILVKVITDAFAPIELDTSAIIEKLPAPEIDEQTGFYSNAQALFSGIMQEDLYDAVTPLAETIVQSSVVDDMCSGASDDSIRLVGNAVGFSVPASGDWQLIQIDMTSDPEWGDSINHIRIDGPNGGGGFFAIDEVRLLHNTGDYIDVVNWNNNEAEEGQTLKHTTVAYIDGAVELALNEENNDPFILFDASHNVENVDQVEIRIRNDSNNSKTGFQVFFSPTETVAVSDTECATRFIDRFASKAYRRSLSEEENDSLLALFDSGSSKENGLERLAQAIMLSGDTLYQVEQQASDTTQALSGNELAERLAFFLWGTIPDDELLAVADSLSDPAILIEQASRMLDSPKATDQLHKFVKEWLKINEPSAKPDFGLTSDSAEAISDSLARFFDFMLREEGGTVFDLYNDNRAFVTPEVADIYGVDLPSDASSYQGGTEVFLPSERAGIVTRAAFIAGLSGTEQTNPTRVGNTIRERILCQHIPLPSDPDDAVIGDAEGLVGRAFVEVHNSNPSCAGCHAYLDNIGLIFESFDPVGNFRTNYSNGESIDPSGYYTSLSKNDIDQEGPIADSVDFSALLSVSNVAAECLAKNMMQYALDRSVEDDKSAFDSVMATFETSNYQLKDLLMAIIQSDAFTQQGAE